jgi:hypothetical protein
LFWTVARLHRFAQELRAALSFVDPALDETGARDVIVDCSVSPSSEISHDLSRPLRYSL